MLSEIPIYPEGNMSSVENGFTQDFVKLSVVSIMKTVVFFGHNIECFQTAYVDYPHPHLPKHYIKPFKVWSPSLSPASLLYFSHSL